MDEEIKTLSAAETPTDSVESDNGNADAPKVFGDAYLDLEAAELGAADDVALPMDGDRSEVSAATLALSELDAVEGAALREEDLRIEFPETSDALPQEWTEPLSEEEALPLEEQAGMEGAEYSAAVATAPASSVATLEEEAAPALETAVAEPPEEPPAPPPAPPPTGRGRRGRRSKKHPDEMEFWDHLEELRARLWRIFIYVLIATCVGWSVNDRVYDLIITGPLVRANLMKPQPKPLTPKEIERLNRTDDLNLLTRAGLRKALERHSKLIDHLRVEVEALKRGVNIITDTPLSGLILRLETSLVVGLILAFPFILFEIWGFVVPALTPTEKHYLRLIFPTSFVLFVSGVSFAYLVAPTMIAFLVGFNPQGVMALWSVQKHIAFLLKLFLGVGIAFQLPLVIVFLAAIELVSYDMLKRVRRHAFVLVFIIAAIVTPTWDPVNLTICALPLYLLYEIGLIAVWFMERGRRKAME